MLPCQIFQICRAAALAACLTGDCPYLWCSAASGAVWGIAGLDRTCTRNQLFMLAAKWVLNIRTMNGFILIKILKVEGLPWWPSG